MDTLFFPLKFNYFTWNWDNNFCLYVVVVRTKGDNTFETLAQWLVHVRDTVTFLDFPFSTVLFIRCICGHNVYLCSLRKQWDLKSMLHFPNYVLRLGIIFCSEEGEGVLFYSSHRGNRGLTTAWNVCLTNFGWTKLN